MLSGSQIFNVAGIYGYPPKAWKNIKTVRGSAGRMHKDWEGGVFKEIFHENFRRQAS